MKENIVLGLDVNKDSFLRASKEFKSFSEEQDRILSKSLGVQSPSSFQKNEFNKVASSYEGPRALLKAPGGGSFMGGLNKNLALLGGGIGLTTGIVSSVKAFEDLEAALVSVKAVSKATSQDLLDFSNINKELSEKYAFTQLELAKGMKFLGMAGFKPDDIKKAIEPIAALSKAEGSSLDNIADIVSNIQTAMNLPVTELTRLTDALAEGYTGANVTVSNLGMSIAKFGSLASGFGVSIEESVALAGILGDIGISAEESGTAIKIMLQRLISNKLDIEDLGVSVQDSSGNLRNVIEILKDLNQVTKGMTNIEKAETLKKIFGSEVQSKVGSILDNINTGRLTTFVENLNNAGGRVQELLAEQMDTAAFLTQQTQVLWDNFLISIGNYFSSFKSGFLEGFLGVFNSMGSTLTDFGLSSDEWTQSIRSLTQVLGVAVGTVLYLGGLIAKLISSIFSKIGGFLGITGDSEKAKEKKKLIGQLSGVEKPKSYTGKSAEYYNKFGLAEKQGNWLLRSKISFRRQFYLDSLKEEDVKSFSGLGKDKQDEKMKEFYGGLQNKLSDDVKKRYGITNLYEDVSSKKRDALLEDVLYNVLHKRDKKPSPVKEVIGQGDKISSLQEPKKKKKDKKEKKKEKEKKNQLKTFKMKKAEKLKNIKKRDTVYAKLVDGVC